LLLAVIGVAIACASGSASNDDEQAHVTWIPNQTATPTVTRPPTPTPAFPTATVVIAATEAPANTNTAAPPTRPAPGVSGFSFPIGGACLPSSDNLMPGAPRAYRAGVHEGVDFYNGYNCAGVGLGTPVLAAKGGTVIRADLNYTELTQAELDAALAAAISSGGTDPESLDTFRGRQVWIEHADGTVTRYAHLSSIASGIRAGLEVSRGAQIGAVGESGTPESITSPGTEYHLHFEIRTGGSYLGAGLSPAATRSVYQQAFS
jgi:peptidoglycan LD-endopeptidase LytH